MANRTSYSYPQSDIGSDPDPSLAGTEKLSLRKMPSPTVREVPEIRKKNKHLDEIYKLKQEVSDLQDVNEGLHVSMRRMALDMGKIEMQLKAETEEHTRKHNKVLSLQQEIGQLSATLKQSKARESTGDMSYDLQEAKSLQTTEVARLTTTLLDKDRQLREKDRQLANTQNTTMSASLAMEEQIAKLSAQLQQEIQMRKSTQQDLALLQQQANMTDSGEMDELRRQCAFYQKNSEQLSKRLMVRDSSRPSAKGPYADGGPRYEMPSRPVRHMPGHF